jgi:hypothetical protein
MIPFFLRSEVVPLASVEFVAAAAVLSVPAPPPAAPLTQQEDVDDVDEATREELHGSTCGAACGYCGRCS